MPTEASFDRGDYVLDTTDDNPDLSVVIKDPGVPADEWTVNEDVGTVADDHDLTGEAATQPIVLVSYIESGLQKRWPDWRKEYPDNLYRGVIDHGVKFYAFPEEVLEEATPDDMAAVL